MVLLDGTSSNTDAKAENYQNSLFDDESYEENEIKEIENKCLINFEKIATVQPFS